MLPMIHCLSTDTLFGFYFVAVHQLPLETHGCIRRKLMERKLILIAYIYLNITLKKYLD